MMDNQAQSMMWLRRLSMTNYRKFGGRFSADANSNGGHSDSMVPGLTVDFDRQMTVLVGENGAGKTAVLDAAAVALGTFLKAFPEVSGLRIQGSDARRKYYSQYGETDIQEQFPVSIYAQADIAQPVENSAGTRESDCCSYRMATGTEQCEREHHIFQGV